MEVLVPAEELKDKEFLEKELGLCFTAALLFDCLSFVSVFPQFPDWQMFESALWNSGKV